MVALVSIVAQRLVRCLCPHCSIPAEDLEVLIARYQLQSIADRFNAGHIGLKQSVGCEHCNHTGFKGRVAIIEYLRCDDEIKQIPKDESFILKAKDTNRKRGGRNLLEDGILKALQGITTLDEVLRVAG